MALPPPAQPAVADTELSSAGTGALYRPCALAAGWALEKFFHFMETEEACCRRMDVMRLQRLFSVVKEVDDVYRGVSIL